MKIVVAVFLGVLIFSVLAAVAGQFGSYALLAYSVLAFIITWATRHSLISHDTNNNLDHLRTNIALLTGQWLSVALFVGTGAYLIAEFMKKEKYSRVDRR